MAKAKRKAASKRSYNPAHDEWTTRVIIYGGIAILLYAGFLLVTLVK